MSGRFSNADVGKPVENETGEVFGRIIETRGDTVSVEPNPGVIASVKAALGWKRTHDETLVIHEDAIETVSDDTVRLESDLDVAAMRAAIGERDPSPETFDVGFDARRSRDETEPFTAVDADRETDSADEPEPSEKRHPAAEADEGGTETDSIRAKVGDDSPEPENREADQAASKPTKPSVPGRWNTPKGPPRSTEPARVMTSRWVTTLLSRWDRGPKRRRGN
ncbi:hypothetical protein [Natrinema salsiterrestre]|uniref:Uncharacterized protein n=1 Tax=Natrinema salsiterrestre TaxID=2950540 RepID=A0A9Q4L6L5_9EURY|nr:hypothetical protein [Natrinema salsiterrestre]MDF9746231.1 hypothetical protein [Natrinema salsiterrestre]